MGFEIPLDCDYTEHPKAIKIIALLGKRADIFPLRLWCWAAKFAKKGVIDGGAKQIEAACKWDGKPGALHAALIEAKVLEADGKTIHDWMEHAGRKVEAYEKKKVAQRESYKKKSSGIIPNSAGILPEETGILPEFCQHSANMPFINEKKRKETETKQKQNETETPPAALSEFQGITDLAQKAAFKQGKGTSPRSIAEWHTHISDLRKKGLAVDVIEREINRAGRFFSEPPWEFSKRLTSEVNAKTPEQERVERLAAEREYARRLREERKAKES